MKAVVLQSANVFSVETVPKPEPATGEVLIRVEASPINPSDIVFLKGLYGTKKPLPAIAGLEGSGVVVSSGGGILGWSLVGKRVAFTAERGGGTWAEFITVPAKVCVKLPQDIPFTLGCCMFCNPFTVMLFADKIREGKHQAIIQTAACSAIGKMLIRYCMQENVTTINIVRRPEQVEALRALGAIHILDSSEENFQEELKKLSVNLNATAAFDCVSGEMTGILVNNMCENSVVYVYGSLSNQPVQGINPAAIIFSNKRVEGLWLSKWIKGKNLLSLWNLSNKVVGMLSTSLRTDVSREFRIEEIVEALAFYKKNMSAGKVILRPSQSGNE